MSRLYQKFKDSVHPPAQPPRQPIPSWSKQDAFGQMQRRTSKPDTTVMRVNAVYYPNYRIYRGDHESPATLNYGCITHVFYAFAKVAPDGRVLLSDEHADLQREVDGEPKGCLGSLLRLKSVHPHLKILISIGGGGTGSDNFADVAASAAKRDTFAQSVYGIVTSAGVDGVDIDWEHPSTPLDGQHFLSLLAQIRIYLPSSTYLLTAALPAGAWALRSIDLYQAADYLSYLNLMAYDFSGSWTPLTSHHAQLFPSNPSSTSTEPCSSSAVTYCREQGFPMRKILLGVPAYGRSFLNVGAGNAGGVAEFLGKTYDGAGGEDGTFEYKELPRPETTEAVDSVAVAAYCVGGDGGFVTYDSPETVKIKGVWARDMGLAGLFYWTGTADVRSGPRSLVQAGFTALHGV